MLFNEKPITKESEDLTYLVFKEFLVHMGLLNESQAGVECRESDLIYNAWYSLGQVRGVTDSETIKLEDLKVFLMAVLRLNDGKHFVGVSTEPRKNERVFGHINADGKLIMCYDEVKIIKKNFEPLYSNHLQFMGKVIEA